MLKHIALIAAFGLVAIPVFAAGSGQAPASKGPALLTDGELDQVVAGDPADFIGVVLPVIGQIQPAGVNLAPTVDGAAAGQANSPANTSSASGLPHIIKLPRPLMPAG
ncbi:MAG TPA: hypothetical protein VI160_02955 [Gemmatimonadales bacterium]